MHGQQNIKFGNAKQAKQTRHYNNIETKLNKTNAAIWYNKRCGLKKLTPNYISIKINGNNPQCRKTKTSHPHRITSTKCRINSCFSRWWAHSCPKHVEIDKYTKNKYTKKKLCTDLALFKRLQRSFQARQCFTNSEAKSPWRGWGTWAWP